MIYGYIRVSTKKQTVARQEKNIKEKYPTATIIAESFTGTKVKDRPEWSKLNRKLKSGDVVVFDAIDRMARNATEGFEVYKDLYDRNIELVFIKNPYANTSVFKEKTQKRIETMTGSTGSKATDKLIQSIIDALNNYTMDIVAEQIQLAFQSAEDEVIRIHKRTSEGMEAKEVTNFVTDEAGNKIYCRQGKISQARQGMKYSTKKQEKTKEIIKKHSKDFGGDLNDAECMKLCGVARGTYYTCKRMVKDEQDKAISEQNDKRLGMVTE